MRETVGEMAKRNDSKKTKAAEFKKSLPTRDFNVPTTSQAAMQDPSATPFMVSFKTPFIRMIVLL